MRVSVTLHHEQPPEDGNQREYEARYQDFNRQYADLSEDPKTGNGICEFDALSFPRVPLVERQQVFTHFSLGVCVAPAAQGGSIIIRGPINPPLVCAPGMIPSLIDVSAVVHAARLATMRKDGRLVDDVKPDPKRGLNL